MGAGGVNGGHFAPNHHMFPHRPLVPIIDECDETIVGKGALTIPPGILPTNGEGNMWEALGYFSVLCAYGVFTRYEFVCGVALILAF